MTVELNPSAQPQPTSSITMAPARQRILIVEDERIVAMDIRGNLEEMGYTVSAISASAEEALAEARKCRPDLAVMDIRIAGDLDGVQTAALLQSIYKIPIVFLTAHSDDATLERALRIEPEGYLLKPFTARALRAAIEVATRKHAAQSQLQLESVTDQLTGLFNRRYLDASLLNEIERSRKADEPLSVLLFDVDHFKVFNDSFGHAAGDAALAAVGEALRVELRPYDLACRYGGEEFVVLLPKTPLKAASQAAERLRLCVRGKVLTHAGQLLSAMTVSIGVAAFPESGQTPAALLEACDLALYRAKREGRDRVVIAGIAH